MSDLLSLLPHDTTIVTIPVDREALPQYAMVIFKFEDVATPPASTLPAPGALGVDVSRHQNKEEYPGRRIPFEAIKASGRTWAYVRATMGAEGRDPFFIQNYKGAKAAGLLVGAYHWLTWNESGAEQARNFLNALGQDLGNLPMVLDLEESNNAPVKDKARCAANIAAFLAEVEGRTSHPIMVYTNNSALDKMITSTDRKMLVKYPLWMASYPRPPVNLANVPRPTPPWASIAAWQYRGGPIANFDPTGGQIPGVVGAIDLDVWLSADRE